MLLCFRCSSETREALDKLVASSSYADYAAVIETAVRNQLLMEQEVAVNGTIVIGGTPAPAASPAAAQRPAAAISPPAKKEKPAPVVTKASIPALFRRDDLPAKPPNGLAELPADVWE